MQKLKSRGDNVDNLSFRLYNTKYKILQRVAIILSTVSVKTKKESTIKWLLNRAFGSRVFPFVTAAVMLACYYTGMDLFAFYYVAVTGIIILTLCDDLTPFITLLAFLTVIISHKHSPSVASGNSGYLFQPAVLAQVITLVVLLVSAGIVRIIIMFCQRKFKFTPMFFGLCALSVAFLLNGLFSKGYTPMNLLYGIFQALIYLGIFVLLKDNIKINGKTFKYVATVFLALSILLVAELFIAYFTTEGIYVNGELHRSKLSFGWGVYNTMGMLLLLCIPSVTYLASLYKHGWILTVYSVVLILSCILSLSRSAMLGAVVIYPLSLIYLIVKTKQRLVNGLIIGGAAIVAIIVVAIKWDSVANSFSQIFENVIVNGQLNGSGRMKLYKTAWEEFLKAPVFGTGFFSGSLEGSAAYNASGLDIIPLFYHNTLFQMAASCGIVGLAAYLVHRCQTVFSFLGNVTVERTYLAVSMLTILFLSLLDVHMFDILPTMLYICFLSVFVATEKKKTETPENPPLFIIEV